MSEVKHPSFPKESAGAVMTTRVPVVGLSTTAGEATAFLKEKIKEFDSINYIYLIDSRHVFVGVVSVKELFSVDPKTVLNTLSPDALVSVRGHTDQERVVQLALKHNIKAVPVINARHEFLGVVTSDVILRIIHDEHTEDVMHFAGVAHRIAKQGGVFSTATLVNVRARLPWLVLGLLGGLCAAFVIEFFEGTLADQLILVAFIPAVVYIADAVGSQTQILFIRHLAIDPTFKPTVYLKRELYINTLLGIALSLLIFVLSYVWVQSLVVSGILAISIFLTVYFSMCIALLLPLFFQKIGADPAVASGPLATVIRDISSLCIYLVVAQVLI